LIPSPPTATREASPAALLGGFTYYVKLETARRMKKGGLGLRAD
jgi:hypothetical protein